MDHRWLAAALCLVACATKTTSPPDVKPGSSAIPTPTPPPPTPTAVADTRPKPTAKPLVRNPDVAPSCGKLATALATPAIPVLGDRLRITGPAGSKAIPRAFGIMDAPEPDDIETRVMVGGGASLGKGNDEALAIVVTETWQLDPDLAKAEPNAIHTPTTFADEAPKFLAAVYGEADIEPVAVADPDIHAYAAWPKQVALGDRDAALVLALLISLPDATLQTVTFHVSPVLVGKAKACTALAERIAASMTLGKRKLVRDAGVRVLENKPWGKLAITVPQDYVVTHKMAEDFDHYDLHKLRPLGLFPGDITVAVDPYPDRSSDGATDREPGTLLGKKVTWTGQRSPRGGFLVATHQVSDRRFIQVVLRATREAAYLDEFKKVAETLTLAKP